MEPLPRYLSISDARANLKALMDQVCADQAPAVITRRGGEPVVMVPLSEWESIQETFYLLSNPVNARRLRECIADAESGKTRTLTPAKIQAMADNPEALIDWINSDPS